MNFKVKVRTFLLELDTLYIPPIGCDEKAYRSIKRIDTPSNIQFVWGGDYYISIDNALKLKDVIHTHTYRAISDELLETLKVVVINFLSELEHKGEVFDNPAYLDGSYMRLKKDTLFANY